MGGGGRGEEERKEKKKRMRKIFVIHPKVRQKQIIIYSLIGRRI